MKNAASGRLIAVVVATTIFAGCTLPAKSGTTSITLSPTIAAVSTLTPAAPRGTATSLAAATATQPKTGSPTPAPSPSASAEKPAPVETSVAGDIPDTQAFVSYRSAEGGYSLDVPEGWARTVSAADTHFVSKLGGVQVTIASASAAPTAATARSHEIAALTQNGRAVQVTQVRDTQLPAGPAVFVEYTSNSEPDAVTGKQVRLENNAYLIFHSGKLATLTLSAPVGADNVDQWKRMAESLKWS